MLDDGASTTLVLGGSGFLGAHVVTAALALAHSRIGALVYSASREPTAGSADGATTETAVGVAFDALRAGEAEVLLNRVAPTRVILCTALSKIAECEAYPALAHALNVELPRRVARWCAAHAARLVTVSTDLVFGGESARAGGYREDDRVAPVSHYGRTKAEGESAVLAADPRALVVRLPLLFGPSGGRGLGASDSVLAAIGRGERPLLFTDEWRTPLSVVEAASALVELLDSDLAGRLHVAGPDRIHRYDLGVRVLQASGCPFDEARTRLRAGKRADAELDGLRPADACLDAGRARSILRTRLSGVTAVNREAFFDES